MSPRDLRIVIVASTGGAVMNELLKQPFFRRQIVAVVSDRACGALERAAEHGVRAENFNERSKARFSDRLLAFLQEQRADYVISFYTRLFVGELLERYNERIINLHPSLLPAFKGLHGFEDAIAYGVRYLGTTIHFIDAAMDEGTIIMQTVTPFDPGQPEALLRHRIFEQQCKSLLQVTRWLAEGRLRVVAGRVQIAGARFDDLAYSPALDDPAAIGLQIPFRQAENPDTGARNEAD